MRSPSTSTALACLALANAAAATIVRVTSYNGTLTTLNLDVEKDTATNYTAKTALEQSDVNRQCGPQPSWLTRNGNALYCINEQFPGGNGTLNTFQVDAQGKLAFINTTDTVPGPVAAVVYAGGKGLAIAGYGGGGFNTYDTTNPTTPKVIQTEFFPFLNQAGRNESRQEKAHVHQVILDPTGGFVLMPDLGSDLIHVYSVDNTTLKLTRAPPLNSANGSGPRHAVFYKGATKTFLYVVHELTNTLVGYETTYNTNKTLGFKQIFSFNTRGENTTLSNQIAAAEILLSPDQRFVVVSSRFDDNLQIDNFDSTNTTQIKSDPLITFGINNATGILAHQQTSPAGGRGPRQFSFNKDGTLVGVALGNDARVVVISRDPSSGAMGEIVAHADIPSQTSGPGFFLFDDA